VGERERAKKESPDQEMNELVARCALYVAPLIVTFQNGSAIWVSCWGHM
jgi:hypothetical protein